MRCARSHNKATQVGDKLMQAIILAGGKGTRLAERLAGKPKPLIDVAGVPLLERQIRLLEAHGIDEIIVLVNHAADQITAFLTSRTFEASIRIVDDGEPRGTAGAVLACLDRMERRAIIVYGDTLFDIDLPHMLSAHDVAGADATLLLHPNDHPADSDLVSLDRDGFVTAFHPYPHSAGDDLRNLVNAAFYVIERDALQRWRDRPVPSDFGQDLFPAMVTNGQRLFGYISAEYIKDLGTPTRLDKVERHLTSGIVAGASRRVPQRTVFIDRDGTLNQLAGHIASPDAIKLIAGAAPSVRRLNDAGLRTVLITNQPVIARGDCDLPMLERIHGRLEGLLSTSGAYLDRIFYCPHHPDPGFAGEVPELKIACDCRKPRPGLIDRAIIEMNIDRYRSWMVGDSSADMLAANRAGLLALLVRTGEGGRDGKYVGVADVIVEDFPAAVTVILEHYPDWLQDAKAVVAKVVGGDVILVDRAAPTGLAAVIRNELQVAGHTAILLKDYDALGSVISDWLAGGANVAHSSSHDRPSMLAADGVLILLHSAGSGDVVTDRTIHRIVTPTLERDDT